VEKMESYNSGGRRALIIVPFIGKTLTELPGNIGKKIAAEDVEE
jgi:hypothetical protein